MTLQLSGREWATLLILLYRSRFLANRVRETEDHTTDGVAVLIKDLTDLIVALESAEENAR
ncbi:hypothetical protein Axy21_006 [Achromobacter phage vB_AxyP_19-32_Axy21]|uniref:Uncharacterized protein n=1 Tax=Achromobacter phage vB_AxyP_19-32_Axy21 TaxID=2591045 RepID=A0A514CVQ8_9CAUD|nr:hypothetical protein Axy21_006 [Achromobacter phage vB_AxyP_19-32_Axy21]